jgi:hypothetical protein
MVEMSIAKQNPRQMAAMIWQGTFTQHPMDHLTVLQLRVSFPLAKRIDARAEQSMRGRDVVSTRLPLAWQNLKKMKGSDKQQ